MDKENDQIEFQQCPKDVPSGNHKKLLTKKSLLFTGVIWIASILIIDISLTIALVILEIRFSGGEYKPFQLAAILTLFLSLKITIILLSSKVIMLLLRRFVQAEI